MPADTIPFSPARSMQAPDANSSPGDKLLIDTADLAHLTSLGVRTLRRMDAVRDIPGRVVVGRRVLYQAEVIREWVRAGLPDKTTWEALTRSRVSGTGRR
jgi:hypothetical protein